MELEKKKKLKRKGMFAGAEILLVILLKNTGHFIPESMPVTGMTVKIILIGAILYLCYLVFEH